MFSAGFVLKVKSGLCGKGINHEICIEGLENIVRKEDYGGKVHFPLFQLCFQ